jgi:hypothetical protein
MDLRFKARMREKWCATGKPHMGDKSGDLNV